MKLKQMREPERAKQEIGELCAALPGDLVGLEVGSFAGESAELFIQSGKFGVLHCVDPWEGLYCKKYKAEQRFDEVVKRHPGKIMKEKGTLFDLMGKVRMDLPFFQFIYIDGRHHYFDVVRDIFQALLFFKPPGYLAGHDYNSKLHPDVTPAVDLVTKRLKRNPKVFRDGSFLFEISEQDFNRIQVR